jgi:hypothetical protein
VTDVPDQSTIVRRFALVTLVLPALLTVAGLVVQLIALPHVPASIPIHWSASGVANGWGPSWLTLVWIALLGFGLPALIGLSSLPSLRRGDRGTTYRFLGAMSLGLSAMQAVLSTWVLLASLRTEGEPSVWLPLTFGLLAWVVGGIAGWFLQPTHTPALQTVHAFTPITLAPGERAAWMRTTALPTWAIVVILVVAAYATIRAVLAWLVGDPGGIAWIVSALAVLLFVLIATTAAFHVRVDERGLTVRSVVGLPRFRVPLDDIATVQVADVAAMGEYGGFGIRGLPGRLAVVMRSGTGIRVTRRDGRTFTVTVADAATGASLLEALVERSGTTPAVS